jgi:hypothetical protein
VSFWHHIPVVPMCNGIFLTKRFYFLVMEQWSSPLSGPKRFEYDEKDKLWISTKDGLNLGHSLSEELHHIFPQLKKMQLKV